MRPLPCFRSTHRIRSVAESILLRFAARSTSWWSGFSAENLLARDEKGKLWYVSVKSHGQPRCLTVYICFLSVIVSHNAGGITSNIRVRYIPGRISIQNYRSQAPTFQEKPDSHTPHFECNCLLAACAATGLQSSWSWVGGQVSPGRAGQKRDGGSQSLATMENRCGTKGLLVNAGTASLQRVWEMDGCASKRQVGSCCIFRAGRWILPLFFGRSVK